MELDFAVREMVRKLESESLDAFEVYGVGEQGLIVEVKRQLLDSFRRSNVTGVAVRCISEGKLGWSATFDLSEKATSKAIAQAIASMKAVSASPETAIAPKKEVPFQFAEPIGRSLDGISDEEKIKIALAIESTAIAEDSRVTRIRKPRYHEWTSHIVVANSHGVFSEGTRSMASCELTAIATDGDISECAYEFEFSPVFEELNFEATAKRAASRACKKLGAVGHASGSHPVILHNRAAAGLMRVLAPSFFADNVQRGKSALVHAMGGKKYSSLINIVDDGLIPGGLGSFPFDGEGTPHGRTLMVSDGIVRSWLYDSARASRDGTISTGNCHRSDVDRTPEIGVSNCFIKEGTSSLQSMFADVQNGLFITDLMGLHTANSITGDFSLGAEGFTIEGGHVSSPVRGITVAGNVHDLFEKTVAVGDDLKFFGQYGAPTISIGRLVIGG